MAGFVEINRNQAIEIMEANSKIMKKYFHSDMIPLLSYDLNKNISIQKRKIHLAEGIKIAESSKTYILNTDTGENAVSVLSIYSHLQENIFNILPIGIKHDMIIIPQQIIGNKL